MPSLTCLSARGCNGLRFGVRPVQRLNVLLCLLLLFLLSPPSFATAEVVVLAVNLNGQAKGEYFIDLTAEGDVLMGAGDLEEIGLSPPPGTTAETAGKPLRSLREMPGVDYTIDEKTLTLHIVAHPSLLPRNAVDFTVERKQKAYFPRDASTFLNYGLDYLDYGSEASGFNLSNQLGIRKGDALFLTDTLLVNTSQESRFARLMTTLNVERRDRLTRWTVGDFFAAAGEPGGSVNMGGVSYAKLYSIDPYFRRYPTLSFSGSLPTPAEVDVYLDGVKMHTEHLPPGDFDLVNITRHGGAGLLELAIRDPYGNEQRIRHPFYLAETLLQRGLHEFSYNLGLERKGFGTESFGYEEPLFSAFHRFGYSNRLTVGLSAEAGKGLFNLAPEAIWQPGAAGVVKGALAGHLGAEGSGFAALLSYAYLGRKLGFRLGLTQFSQAFANLATARKADRPKYEYSGAVSYVTRDFGSLSLELAAAADHAGGSRQSTTLTYSRALHKDLSLFATLRQARDAGESSSTLLLSLNYHPWPTVQASGRLEIKDDANAQSLQLQKNPPLGEGYGYQVALERSAGPEQSVSTVGGNLQYNGRRGIYRGDLQGEGGGGTALRYRLSAAGAVAYIGKGYTLTRPIRDSFALVKVGSLAGVRVYHNAQEIGRTDATGKVFVPDLNSYYENQIAIEDKDIPMDYALPAVTRFVVPPLRSGSCVVFSAVQFHPVIGRLLLDREAGALPLEFKELRLSFNGRTASVPTGKGGEFYLDPTESGPSEEGSLEGCAALEGKEEASGAITEIRGEVEHGGRMYDFRLLVPESDQLFVDLGKIVVGGPASNPPQPENEQTEER